MYLLSAAAVLSLLSVSTAIAQQCEDLIQPLVLDNVSPLLGKWIFLVGSSDYQRYAAMLKMLNSSWMDIVMSSHNDTVVINQATMSGKCIYSSENMTISSNTFHMSYTNGTLNGTFLSTCPDCLLLSFTTLDAGDVTRELYLFGRTGKLSPSDRETHRRKAECLGFLPPSFTYDGQQVLCPEEKKNADTEVKRDHKDVKHESD